MRRIAATLAVVALLFSAGTAGADYADGMAAALRGNYARALHEFRPLAELGNAEAQYSLGVIYTNGHGVTKSDAEAAKWYRMAAEQGLAEAQYNLGAMYAKGIGVPENDAPGLYGRILMSEAVKWYRKAAEQGCEGISLIDTPALPLATVAV